MTKINFSEKNVKKYDQIYFIVHKPNRDRLKKIRESQNLREEKK